MEYRVVWEIDIEAESPEAAAREALAIQRDPESDAQVFEVHEHSEEGYVFKKAETIDICAIDSPLGQRGFFGEGE